MATKYITAKGKAYWAKVFPENKDATGYDNELVATGGQYVVSMELDADSIHDLTMAKSQVPAYAKEVEVDGEKRILHKFKRYHEKYNRAGDLLEWASGAPKVVGPDGSPFDVETDGFIGNGSDLEVTVCVYEAGKVVGTRIESIKVVNQVKYEEKEMA